MTETISLMPEPGTPQYDAMLRWMRQAYADPRQVNFRREVTRDGANVAFLTQGGTLPLPEVKDPVRKASQITVTLLLDGPVDSEDMLMDEVEDALRGLYIEDRKIIDVLIPEPPTDVTVLDERHYQAGDHFTNPITPQTDPDADGCTSTDPDHVRDYH